jgi:hypothetical protein
MTQLPTFPSKAVRLIEMPVITDPRGHLVFVEGGNHVPFDIARVYYLYNVPVDAERGGHAHHDLEQVIFALSGSFRVRLDDGRTSHDFWLRDPRRGLYLKQMVWREIDRFSQGAICMVLASLPYEELDYIRDHEDFLAAVRSRSS